MNVIETVLLRDDPDDGQAAATSEPKLVIHYQSVKRTQAIAE
jgi:hypothetical protein